MSGSRAIYDSQKVTDELLSRMTQMPEHFLALFSGIKDIAQELRELENCGYDPDTRLKELINEIINSQYLYKKRIQHLEQHILEIIEKCGWDVDYNDKIDYYFVTGPCSDD